jgi:hypothetical protein
MGIGLVTFWISTFFGEFPPTFMCITQRSTRLTAVLGVMGVSFIHCQIGTTLDQMTSPEDFHLISVRLYAVLHSAARGTDESLCVCAITSLKWRNFFGLAGVVFAALAPVAMRMRWRNELEDAAGDGTEGQIRLPNDGGVDGVADGIGQEGGISKPKPLIFLNDDDYDDDARSIISLARSDRSEQDGEEDDTSSRSEQRGKEQKGKARRWSLTATATTPRL